ASSDLWGGSQDFVTQGVRTGYALLREQMDRGQRYAEQIQGGFGTMGTMPDMRGLLEQTLYFYSDAMLRWFEPFLPPRPQGGGAAPPLPVEIPSPRPPRSPLRLFAGAQSPFDAWPLYARDRAKPPLQDVRFIRYSAGVALAVRVPDNQPADLYLGVISN